MVATYRIKADEIGKNITDSIRSAFGDQEVELIIRNIDDTDHLLSTQANREHLEAAMERSRDAGNRITVNLDELE